MGAFGSRALFHGARGRRQAYFVGAVNTLAQAAWFRLPAAC